MPDILLADLASPANPGDQAIFLGTLKLIRDCLPGSKVTVATRGFSHHDVYERLGCRVVPSYPNPEAIESDDCPAKFFRAAETFAQPGPLRDAVREADLVFLAGGAYFYSCRRFFPGLTFLSHLTPVYWAKRFGKKVVCLPQSFGPFQSFPAQALFDRAVRRMDLVLFRENISGDWLRRRYPALESRFHFMPDLAFSLESKDLMPGGDLRSPAEQSGKKRIGVTVRSWHEGQNALESYLDALAGTLAWLMSDYGYEVSVIVQVQSRKKNEGDEWVSQRLLEKLGRLKPAAPVNLEVSRPYFDVPALCRLYRSCDFLIGMRLHSALLGFVLGVPALTAGYQHKAEGILESAGLRDLYLGTYSQLSAGGLQSACKKVIGENVRWRAEIEKSLGRARREIRRVFDKNVVPLIQ